MDSYVDLILDNVGQLCVIPAHDGGPQRGHQLGDLGIITEAAIAIDNGQIVAIGSRHDLLENHRALYELDVQGRVVTPGLIDPHTHLIWAGDRADEFEQRLQGVTYQEIMAAGGGINRTVQATRDAMLFELVDEAKLRLNRMLRHGTTTVECKTGYGLNSDTEITMLNAIALLDAECEIDVVPTFLGAHAIPPEFANDPDGYVQLLVEQMIPAAAAWQSENWPGPLYCDVFCEEGAFTLEQTRLILEAAQLAGMPLRVHADEFASLGATALAVEMGAVSVDHLLATTPDDVVRLGTSATIAILLPATPFGLGIANTAPARALLDAGAALAIATDCNPGTAWCESMQMPLALATRTLGLTPSQALAAATINAAYAVGRGDIIGSIEVGKIADLVVWDVPDYRHLGYRFGANLVHTVIKNGEIVVEP
ncbi:MAG: imidazolonepropionase [Chloroflexota bacterium]